MYPQQNQQPYVGGPPPNQYNQPMMQNQFYPQPMGPAAYQQPHVQMQTYPAPMHPAPMAAAPINPVGMVGVAPMHPAPMPAAVPLNPVGMPAPAPYPAPMPTAAPLNPVVMPVHQPQPQPVQPAPMVVPQNNAQPPAALGGVAPTGRAMIKPKEEKEDEEDANVANEHQSLDYIPLSASPVELLTHLGAGVMWYFTFIKYVWVVNFVLSLVALINVIPYFVDIGKNKTSVGFPDITFLASYPKTVKPYWIASSIISVIIVCFTGAVYRFYVDWYEGKRQRGDQDYVEDPFEGQYGVDTADSVDRIEYPEGPPKRSAQLTGRVISASIFLVVLFVQGIINFFAQRLLRNLGTTSTATILSGVVVAINIFWGYLCKVLTRLEKHNFWSDFRRWDCFKQFVFKICNVLVLYLVKNLEATTNSSSQCVLVSMASQFFWLLILDLCVSTVGGIAFPVVMNALTAKAAETSDRSNQESKQDFDLADEYVEVVYRQFIVMLGSLVLPLLPAVALVGNVFEYWCDKYRMLRLSQRPKLTKNTFKGMLIFFYVLTGLATVFSWPNGALWILSGSNSIKSNPACTIFN